MFGYKDDRDSLIELRRQNERLAAEMKELRSEIEYLAKETGIELRKEKPQEGDEV